MQLVLKIIMCDEKKYIKMSMTFFFLPRLITFEHEQHQSPRTWKAPRALIDELIDLDETWDKNGYGLCN